MLRSVTEVFFASAIRQSGAHVCAIFQGSPVCWGANDAGQIGVAGISGATQVLSPAPMTLVRGNIFSFSMGASHTCALTSAGIQCLGSNDSGQLGSGTTTNIFVWTPQTL